MIRTRKAKRVQIRHGTVGETMKAYVCIQYAMRELVACELSDVCVRRDTPEKRV